MEEPNSLAERFEAHRARLRAVAFRMLGSLAEADDAVQETWLRLSRAQTGQVENLGGWLTTVAARVCLDILRARASRKEEPLDPAHVSAIPDPSRRVDPEDEALTADAVGLALLVVLDRLTPAERIAFVLHDMFDVPFAEVASIVGRSPVAATKLASRARTQVRGGTVHHADLTRRWEIVERRPRGRPPGSAGTARPRRCPAGRSLGDPGHRTGRAPRRTGRRGRNAALRPDRDTLCAAGTDRW